MVADSVLSIGKLAWSPDSVHIAFTAATSPRVADIYAVNVDGSGKKKLTAGLFRNVAPSWSADGTTIVFASSRGGSSDIYAVPAQGGPARRITKTPARNQFPRLAPDGKRVVFRSSTSGDADTECESITDHPNLRHSSIGGSPPLATSSCEETCSGNVCTFSNSVSFVP